MITANEAKELSGKQTLPEEIFEEIKRRSLIGNTSSEFVVSPDNDRYYYKTMLEDLGYTITKHEVYDRHTYFISW